MESSYRIERTLTVSGKEYHYFSLPDLEKMGFKVSRLPLSIRIILESLIRNMDGRAVTQEDVENLIRWDAHNVPDTEIPFKVARVVMQDFTGVPAVVDLAAMRDKVREMGIDPTLIQPQVPVDLVIDHSVQVDFYGVPQALELNREKEFERNTERYRFLKWAQNAFSNLRVIPPSVGIIHQVNLEYLAKVVMTATKEGKTYAFPDTLVGTDSHTTMINGLGIVGWGVGGIEAEAAMLDQPVTFKTPEVVGVNLHGRLRPGVTATDLVLTLTELLRKHNVVGKFVEFYGPGVSSLSLPDRATLSNMCPEYGATLALFPVDEETISYLRMAGRPEEQVELVEKYMKAQGLFGAQKNVDYSEVIDLDLSTVESSVAGPSLPQQRVPLGRIGDSFLKYLETSSQDRSSNGQVYLKASKIKVRGREETLRDGDVVIAAITSCTNTSNPKVMVAAGLLAKKAVERGLAVSPKVKTSLAPGSRVVSDYLEKSGLQAYLDRLGFYTVGFGCTTCIGNSGPLDPAIEEAIVKDGLATAAVLSGNRNFEARIHRNVRANYLMSPPLVVAFAIAGTVVKDLEHEPIGKGSDGRDVYLKDIWPSDEEVNGVIANTIKREMFIEKYRDVNAFNERWNSLDAPSGLLYAWDEKSTYIRRPPFFDGFSVDVPEEPEELRDARPLLVLGDSVTTDHISPAGSIARDSPAGKYLMEHGVRPEDFNSYGARRGNHEVMMRGTFGNNRIKNALAGREGPYTKYLPAGEVMFVYDAAVKYMKEGVPLVVFAGKEYGSGSSRDWAAKGPMLIGVKAVVARSFERIHRSNLIGMGILPLQFPDGQDINSIKADTSKPFTIDLRGALKPGGRARMRFTTTEGKPGEVVLTVRLDTPIEVEYYRHGGILQFVMRKILTEAKS